MGRPILFAVAGLFAAFALSACTKSNTPELDGLFRGTDGSNLVPSQVEWHLALTGDGLLTGIWNSQGEITQAQLSGKLGIFGNELILFVTTGHCLGEFRGNFTYQAHVLRGVLKGNPICPDRSYTFELKRSAP